MLGNILIKTLLMPISALKGHFVFNKGTKLEKEGKYKEACYEYGISILSGGIINQYKVKNRIKYLWENYGPFDYDQDIKDYISIHGDTPERCSEAGHQAVISIINESIK